MNTNLLTVYNIYIDINVNEPEAINFYMLRFTACDSSCASCFPDNPKCMMCLPGTALHHGKCISQCPAQHYLDTHSRCRGRPNRQYLKLCHPFLVGENVLVLLVLILHLVVVVSLLLRHHLFLLLQPATVVKFSILTIFHICFSILSPYFSSLATLTLQILKRLNDLFMKSKFWD